MDLTQTDSIISLLEVAYGVKLNTEQTDIVKKALGIMQPHLKNPNYSLDTVISDLSSAFKIDNNKLKTYVDENKPKIQEQLEKYIPVPNSLGEINILPDEHTDVKIIIDDGKDKTEETQ